MRKPRPALLTEHDMDEGIRPIVEALRSHPRVQTTSSCSGHADDPDHTWHGQAYVAVYVGGMAGIGLLVQILDGLDSVFGYDEGWEATIIYSREVASACDFEEYPDWVAFQLESRKALTREQIAAHANFIKSVLDG